MTGAFGTAPGHRRALRWLVGMAVAVRLALGAGLAVACSGFHYDEALTVRAASHLLWGAGPPPFAHHHASWVPVGRSWLPLMILPYVGALPAYLAVPLMAVAGPSAAAVRLLDLALSTAGLLALVWLAWRELGAPGATALAWLLALHPSLLAHTVLDNSVVAPWMAVTGLAAVAGRWALRRPRPCSLLTLGATLGLAAWVRLNTVWLAVAAATGLLAVVRPRLAPLASRARWVLLGAVVGGAPLIAYELASRFGTLVFVAHARTASGPWERLVRRLGALAVTLLADDERRAVWGGAPPPSWQVVAVVGAAAVAVVAGALPGRGPARAVVRWGRGATATLAVFVLLNVTSTLHVAPHHLVTVVPLVALAAVAGVTRGLARAAGGRAGTVVLLTAVSGLFLWWDVGAVAALARTGGLGLWSGAVPRIARDLERLGVEEVTVGSWGLANPVYVLTRARVRCREVFWDAVPAGTAEGRSWDAVVAEGRPVLLGTTPGVPSAAPWLLRALRRGWRLVSVRRYRDGRGRPVGVLYLPAAGGVTPGRARTRPRPGS